MDSGCWVAEGEAGRAAWEAAGIIEASDAGGLTRVALGGEGSGGINVLFQAGLADAARDAVRERGGQE